MPVRKPRLKTETRRRALLEAVAAGETNATIAIRLGLSEKTVEYHLTRLFARAGVRSRAGWVAEAARRGQLPAASIPRPATTSPRVGEDELRVQLTLAYGYAELVAGDTRVPAEARSQAEHACAAVATLATLVLGTDDPAVKALASLTTVGDVVAGGGEMPRASTLLPCA